uniref:hypothetical protein n=1 Tax=Thaumasiovibrio occultus TaxID=1891184 RepID=UPI000B35F55D|nr:hypothetical protein [Thaumasiovibrio occultus]
MRFPTWIVFVVLVQGCNAGDENTVGLSDKVVDSPENSTEEIRTGVHISYNEFQQQVKASADISSIDCGTSTYGREQLLNAKRCVESAYNSNQPFHVVAEYAGMDTFMATATTMDANGVVISWSYDENCLPTSNTELFCDSGFGYEECENPHIKTDDDVDIAFYFSNERDRFFYCSNENPRWNEPDEVVNQG